MNNYSIYKDGNEGIDFVIELRHEKLFTKEEFDIIVEESIVYALEKEYNEEGFCYLSSLNTQFMWEYLDSKGFLPPEKSICHWISDDEKFKNEKLIQWCNRKTYGNVSYSKVKPKYLT
jgi:hypothetical protein